MLVAWLPLLLYRSVYSLLILLSWNFSQYVTATLLCLFYLLIQIWSNLIIVSFFFFFSFFFNAIQVFYFFILAWWWVYLLSSLELLAFCSLGDYSTCQSCALLREGLHLLTLWLRHIFLSHWEGACSVQIALWAEVYRDLSLTHASLLMDFVIIFHRVTLLSL